MAQRDGIGGENPVTQGPGLPFGPRMMARYADVGGLVPQGESAEIIAERWKLSRTELDEIAVRSHANAAAAADSGGLCITSYVMCS